MVFKSFLLKYAEIGVKGKNRSLFEEALAQQVKYALRRCEGEFKVRRTRGRIYVDVLSDYYDYDETVDNLKTVFGVTAICPMIQVNDEGFEKLSEVVRDYVGEAYENKNFTFKVDTRRALKDYPMESMEVNSAIGGVLLRAYPEMGSGKTIS